MTFLKSLWGLIWAVLVVAWRAIELVLYGIWMVIMWIGSAIRFVWMFIFMLTAIIIRYACFGFNEGWKLAGKALEVENE